MPRLPIVDSDDNAWGTVLNEFLEVLHNADGTFKHISIGGADADTPPNQITPISVGMATGGAYAESGTGNIFQISGWAENSGTKAVVGVFGEGRALGDGSRAWGGNFVGYGNHGGATINGVEVNYGHLVTRTTGGATGLALICTGGNGANRAMAIRSGDSASVPIYGIDFMRNGTTEPASSALIRSEASIATPYGIDFSASAFATYGISLGANALLAGLVRTAKSSDTALILMELENLSTTNTTAKGMVLAFFGRDTVDSRKATSYVQSIPQDANWIGGDLSFHTRASNATAERVRLSSVALMLKALYEEWDEIADPAAPAANKARLYARDNGAGKTQLVAVFPTGAVQVIATEP